MNLSAIYHRPTLEFIYPRSENELEVQLIAAAKDVKEVELFYWPRHLHERTGIRHVRMPVAFCDRYRAYYRESVILDETAAYTRYCFRLYDGEQAVWLGKFGFEKKMPDLNGSFFEFLWPNLSDGHPAPEWSGEQVYYQIFPDRFCNGNPSLTPKGAALWGSVPTRDNLMGGDLQGIMRQLGYLSNLGITCIYLTPVFCGASNHKYDTADYYHIDAQFGGDDAFRSLVKKAHDYDIRIILDGVFNHCGTEFPYFRDLLEKGESSAYVNWFFPHTLPVSIDAGNYDCVGHYKWMPKLNLSNSETADYFVDVGEYWIREFGIDGWRLDVADEVPVAFWKRFSTDLKEKFPDTVLIGETWGDAQKLINDAGLDSAMNYLFKDAVTDWIAKGKISVSEFDDRVNHMLGLYPTEVDMRMYNLLDSHDTPRFLYDCGGDLKKFKAAVALQMTFPGCPAIFYGDEIGLTGDNDPLCRQAMIWDEKKQDSGLLSWYRELIALRRAHPSLLRGQFRTKICDDEKNLYGYVRKLGDETTLIVLNAGGTAQSCFMGSDKAGGEWEQIFPSGEALAQAGPANGFSVPFSAYSVKVFQQIKH